MVIESLRLENISRISPKIYPPWPNPPVKNVLQCHRAWQDVPPSPPPELSGTHWGTKRGTAIFWELDVGCVGLREMNPANHAASPQEGELRAHPGVTSSQMSPWKGNKVGMQLGVSCWYNFLEDHGVKVEQAAQNYDLRGLGDALEPRRFEGHP